MHDLRRSRKNKITGQGPQRHHLRMNTTTRIKQVISVAFIGCAVAASATASCGVLHPGDCVKKASNAATAAWKDINYKAADNALAKAEGFEDAKAAGKYLAAYGYTSDNSDVFSRYVNKAEIDAYQQLAVYQGYANLAAADAQAGVYGGYHNFAKGVPIPVPNYASLKARLAAESMPLVAADVAKFQAAYQTTVAAAKVAYAAAEPYLNVAITDGTTLQSLIIKSCQSGGYSSVAAEQSAMAPFIANMKKLDADNLLAVNRILRSLLTGKTPDQSIAHDLQQIGTDIGILKTTGTSTGPANYKGSTWGLSVSISGGWIGNGSWSAAFNMNTEPFVTRSPISALNQYHYGYSLSTNPGMSVEAGSNDVEPGVTIGFGVGLGAGDSTAANQGVSFAAGVAGGAPLQFSSSLGWIFPNPTMQNLQSLFNAFKTAEKALYDSAKQGVSGKGVSGKDMLAAGYKTGNQAVDAALGPVVSTLQTLCSVPGISIGMGLTFAGSAADLSITPGYSAVLWSGTI